MIRFNGVVLSLGCHIENTLVANISITVNNNGELQKFKIYYILRAMLV